MYKKDPTSVSRILDIAQEAKVINNNYNQAVFYLQFINITYDRLLFIY